MSMSPGSRPLSRGQAASARSVSRRVGTGRRDRRQGGRRPIQVLFVSGAKIVSVANIVSSANTSIEGVTYDTLDLGFVSPEFISGARVPVTELPPETPALDSELNDIFTQLNDLDFSISDANHAIDELRESTRSIIVDMLGKG
jgi:hypothetical protein